MLLTMAASMRVWQQTRLCNTLTNLKHFKLRYVLLCENQCRRSFCQKSACFSQKTDKQETDAEKSEPEDFFGIPKDFKLQNVFVEHRHSQDPTDTQKRDVAAASRTHNDQDFNLNGATTSSSLFPTNAKSSAPINAVDDLEIESSSTNVSSSTSSNFPARQRRIDKRRQKDLRPEAVFSTHFGTVTIDQASMGREKIEDITVKAREILYKNNSESTTSTSKNRCNSRQSTPQSQENNSLRNEEFLNIDEHSQKAVQSNFFDDIYFPELSQSDSTNDKYKNASSKIKSELPDESDALSSDHSWRKTTSVRKDTKRTTTQPGAEIKNFNKEKSSINEGTNFFDEQYFSSHEESLQLKDQGREEAKETRSPHDSEFSPIDEHFFGSSMSPTEHKNHSDNSRTENDEFNEFDEQYFGDSFRDLQPRRPNDNKINNVSFNSSFTNVVKEYSDHTAEPFTSQESQDLFPDARTVHESNYNDDSLDNTNLQPSQENIISNESFLKEKSQRNFSQKTAAPNLENPETPFDLAMKIRRDLRLNIKAKDQEEDKIVSTFKSSTKKAKDEDDSEKANRKLDSKGYRSFVDQMPSLEKMTSADVIRMLKDRIIFDHEDFLGIDKPYGLASFSQQNDKMSMSELLPAFMESLPKSYKADDLHLVHGLDRDVTGAIILAKNPEVAYMLRAMYKNKEDVIQRFWTITKGIPSPPTGLVDIPIGEGKVGDTYKMILRPLKIKAKRASMMAPVKMSKAPSQRAITEYRVLSSHLQSALVECTLLTSDVKHQLRVHLANGLNTPILGDHKYSHFFKLAPQKLHPSMLELLKLRQAKVRNIALHLHCRTIVLKNYKERMIFLTTNPPPFFKDNLKTLKLFIPKK